jgi:hypothetical protein
MLFPMVVDSGTNVAVMSVFPGVVGGSTATNVSVALYFTVSEIEAERRVAIGRTAKARWAPPSLAGRVALPEPSKGKHETKLNPDGHDPLPEIVPSRFAGHTWRAAEDVACN